jgi:tetratricopeptide (TPR) repeat protein
VTINRIGHLDLRQGRLDAAEASFDQALKMYREHGDVEGQSAALASLGDLARARKRTADADRFYRQGLELAQAFGVREGEAGILVSLGEMALERGDATAAIDDFRDARDLFREIGLTPDVDDMDARLKAAGATSSPEGAEN